jgi:hypothetical protein
MIPWKNVAFPSFSMTDRHTNGTHCDTRLSSTSYSSLLSYLAVVCVDFRNRRKPTISASSKIEIVSEKKIAGSALSPFILLTPKHLTIIDRSLQTGRVFFAAIDYTLNPTQLIMKEVETLANVHVVVGPQAIMSPPSSYYHDRPYAILSCTKLAIIRRPPFGISIQMAVWIQLAARTLVISPFPFPWMTVQPKHLFLPTDSVIIQTNITRQVLSDLSIVRAYARCKLAQREKTPHSGVFHWASPPTITAYLFFPVHSAHITLYISPVLLVQVCGV